MGFTAFFSSAFYRSGKALMNY